MPPQWRGDARVEGLPVRLLDLGRAPNGEGTQEGGLARVEGRMSPGSVGLDTSQSAGLGDSQSTGSTHRRAPNSMTRRALARYIAECWLDTSQGSELGDSLGTGFPNTPRGEASAFLSTAKGAAPPHDRPQQKRLGCDCLTQSHPSSSLKKAATYSPTFAVPSAQLGLTSLFGMGRGGTPTL